MPSKLEENERNEIICERKISKDIWKATKIAGKTENLVENSNM